MYGTQVSTRPPRIRIFVNAPSLVTRDYGYWVENELRQRFGLEGVPVSIDFVERARREARRRRRRLVGDGVRRAPPRPRARVTLACRDPAQARGDRARRAATRATSARRPARGRRRRRRGGAGRGGRARRRRRAERAFGEVVAALPGDAPVLTLTKGLDPATGERLSTLVHGRPVAVLSGPEHRGRDRRAGLPAAAVIASEDAALARAAPAGDHVDRLPGLRQRRRRRRRAVRGGEERDRARRRRRRRARPGRQRQGGARRARARRDGPPRRGRRRRAGDVRRSRGHGRPDRHLLVAVGTQPPRGRADRARRDARARPRPRSAWSSRA